MNTNAGFTLIELIVVITLTGIVALLVGRNIGRPVEGFVDLGRRAELVDIAELALQRLSREIRLALPNSVRLTDGATQNLQACTASGGAVCAVEILRTSEGGRYRDRPDGTNFDQCAMPDNDRLRFTVSNDCFEILGPLTVVPDAAPGANQTDCLQGNVDCLVIFNTGQSGADAYNGDNIAGIQAASANAITFDISGGAASRFPFRSPRQRFHIVDMPVSFVCDSTAGTLTRYEDYVISSTQSLNPGGTVALLVNRVLSCTFTYSQGTSSRNALLTAVIVVRDIDTQGNPNDVRLAHQISVPNVP
ncbi:MAG: type II secretion system protein [Gammaproteobacteria bacterium]|nr:type II secretion system protein [Gammaproteobacteria bacterium]